MRPVNGRSRTSQPPATSKILLVGGYGQVGKLVARQLAPHYPNRLIIAGRRIEEARKAAGESGHGAEGRCIDLRSAVGVEALDGIGVVLVCLDQTNFGFAERCLASGIHYLDVSSRYGFLKQVEQLDTTARKAGSVALLSLGLAPGLTNLMAAQAVRLIDEVDRIDLFVQLGLGERHGKAAVEWMLDNLDAVYPVRQDGRVRCVRSFGAGRSVRFPNEPRKRWAHRFAFSDQITLGQTLRVPSVSTWLCFNSRVATLLFALVARSRLARLLHRNPWRGWAVKLFRNMPFGSDRFMVAARAHGKVDNRKSVLELDVGGRSEAVMTAVIAAAAVRLAADNAPAPGVHHIEQIMDLETVVPAMKREVLGFVANAASSSWDLPVGTAAA